MEPFAADATDGDKRISVPLEDGRIARQVHR
jgi:hypothetical protein